MARNAMEVLREAHELGLEKLSLLEGAAQELKGGKEVSLSVANTLREVLQFFDGELRVHFRHEEEVLFPALEGIIGRAGPIAVMLDEHQSLWKSIDALRETVSQFEDDHHQLAGPVEQLTAHIVWLLQSHIQKENTVLFPLAERILDHSVMEGISKEMEGIERGTPSASPQI